MKRVLLVLALALAVAGCGETKKQPEKTTGVRVYFLLHGKMQPVARSVPAATAMVEAWTRLGKLSPAETKLGLAVGSGFPPGSTGWSLGLSSDGVPSLSAGELPRPFLARVVYTHSSFSKTGSVEVNGRRYTRADFEDLTPAILVESPLPFETVSSPTHASGSANTFEATFEYALTDADGKVLATHFVTATSGSGTRGTFAVTIPFTVSHGGPGTLTVYERSAKDGSKIHVVAIPLQLKSG